MLTSQAVREITSGLVVIREQCGNTRYKGDALDDSTGTVPSWVMVYAHGFPAAIRTLLR